VADKHLEGTQQLAVSGCHIALLFGDFRQPP
jgi:hypothetical protein